MVFKYTLSKPAQQTVICLCVCTVYAVPGHNSRVCCLPQGLCSLIYRSQRYKQTVYVLWYCSSFRLNFVKLIVLMGQQSKINNTILIYLYFFYRFKDFLTPYAQHYESKPGYLYI